MRLEDFDTQDKLQATIKETTRITPEESEDEIRNIVLEVDKKDFTFDVGQSIGIIVPGPHEFGHGDHFRLYTVASTFEPSNGGKPKVEICVKRVSYLDEVTGERYPGIASNYLCDRKIGDQITMTGPYGHPFQVPDDKSADILMIGLGTGIAPFRAFIKQIYKNLGGWEGNVRLFYGAKSGLEMLYMNDKQNDFVNYYDEDTFKAFAAISPRPHMDDPIPLDKTLEKHSQEIWAMVQKPDTRVFVAGLEKMVEPLDKAFAKMAGSKEKWELRKAELTAGGRWTELIY